MKLYTKNNCSACKQVKRSLEDRGQTFQEINVEENYDAAVRLVELGYRSVPIAEFESGTWLSGSALYDYAK